MIKGISHIGVAVRDLDEVRIFFREKFGLESSDPEIIAKGTIRASFIKLNEINLELMESHAPNSGIAKFIDKNGEGIHHLSLEVDGIQTHLDDLKNNGVQLINEKAYPNAHGELVAFMHPKSVHGILIELIESNC